MWCAATIWTEPELPYEFRKICAQALLFHDIKEDTVDPLPSWVPEIVVDLVDKLTFLGGTAEEVEEVWKRPEEVRLMKLYDKVSSLLDVGALPEAEKAVFVAHTKRLLKDVEENYGELNITRIARGLLSTM
ncbi:MAG: hypothetical protein ABII13_01205 [Patescibacteria group bacterium]